MMHTGHCGHINRTSTQLKIGQHLQGQLWAYSSGFLTLHALAWQGTVYGEILRHGSFVVFFIVFHVFIAVYFGRRIAVLSACLFFALFALRWEGSALTAYPLIAWVPVTLFFGSILLARGYYRHGQWSLLAAAGFFLFWSLFTYEGLTVLFCIVFPLMLAANVINDTNKNTLFFEFTGRTRTRNLSIMFGLAVAVCFVLSVTSLYQMHPSQYEGHAIASFRPLQIAQVAFSFATSGFPSTVFFSHTPSTFPTQCPDGVLALFMSPSALCEL